MTTRDDLEHIWNAPGVADPARLLGWLPEAEVYRPTLPFMREGETPKPESRFGFVAVPRQPRAGAPRRKTAKQKAREGKRP